VRELAGRVRVPFWWRATPTGLAFSLTRRRGRVPRRPAVERSSTGSPNRRPSPPAGRRCRCVGCARRVDLFVHAQGGYFTETTCLEQHHGVTEHPGSALGRSAPQFPAGCGPSPRCYDLGLVVGRCPSHYRNDGLRPDRLLAGVLTASPAAPRSARPRYASSSPARSPCPLAGGGKRLRLGALCRAVGAPPRVCGRSCPAPGRVVRHVVAGEVGWPPGGALLATKDETVVELTARSLQAHLPGLDKPGRRAACRTGWRVQQRDGDPAFEAGSAVKPLCSWRNPSCRSAVA